MMSIEDSNIGVMLFFLSVASMVHASMQWISGSLRHYTRQHLRTVLKSALCCCLTEPTQHWSTVTQRVHLTWHQHESLPIEFSVSQTVFVRFRMYVLVVKRFATVNYRQLLLVLVTEDSLHCGHGCLVMLKCYRWLVIDISLSLFCVLHVSGVQRPSSS